MTCTQSFSHKLPHNSMAVVGAWQAQAPALLAMGNVWLLCTICAFLFKSWYRIRHVRMSCSRILHAQSPPPTPPTGSAIVKASVRIAIEQ